MFYVENEDGIILFNHDKDSLKINAEMIAFDLSDEMIKQTEQEIVPAYNLVETGLYYIKGNEPLPPLNMLKAEKIEKINQEYSKKADFIRIDTPNDEVMTWDIQKNEAQLWQKDNTVPTPFIDILAQSREVEKSWLIEKILTKVVDYNLYIANLTGYRQKLEDEIKAAQTFDEVEAVKWQK